MGVEIAGGVLTNSIALISDAGHMFTHGFAIGISLVAILIARKPLCHHRTFGLYRAEILAAFVNGLFLLVVAGMIIAEAVGRMLNPREILGVEMLIVAFMGLATNIASILILHGSHREDLNIRSVFYHMIADAASSVGIIIAAVVIIFTGWHILDPLVSVGISLVIVFWAWSILKESAKILLEMAPTGLNVDIVEQDLYASFSEIKTLENTHLWSITADMLVFSTHVTVDKKLESSIRCEELIKKIGDYLCQKYRFIETTIQIVTKN